MGLENLTRQSLTEKIKRPQGKLCNHCKNKRNKKFFQGTQFPQSQEICVACIALTIDTFGLFQSIVKG